MARKIRVGSSRSFATRGVPQGDGWGQEVFDGVGLRGLHRGSAKPLLVIDLLAERWSCRDHENRPTETMVDELCSLASLGMERQHLVRENCDGLCQLSESMQIIPIVFVYVLLCKKECHEID